METDTAWSTITTNAVFDKLYSVTKYVSRETRPFVPRLRVYARILCASCRYWQEVSDTTRVKWISVLTSALSSLLRAIAAGDAAKQAVGDDSDGSGDDGDEDFDDEEGDCPANRRNAFKQLVYLLCESCQVSSKLDTEAAAKADKPARGKGKAGDANANKLHVCLEKALTALTTATDSEFQRLWPLGVPEEVREPFQRFQTHALPCVCTNSCCCGPEMQEFLGILPKTAFIIVESASCMKNKSIRAHCVQLAATALARFPVLVTTTTVSVLHIVSALEHVGGVLADILGELSATFRDTSLLKEILREMGRLNTVDSKDTTGISNAAKFLSKLSEQAPRDLLANLAVLLPHLDGPSYTLRSAIVTSMGNIVSKVFPQGDEAEAEAAAASAAPASTSARDTLLDVMQERVRDVHANTRGAVLKAWAQLCADGALPLDRLHTVAAIAVDRLKDKTSTVRSAAMQLVATLLETSPFGTNLNPATFAEHLQVEEAWFAERKQAKQLVVDEEDEEDATAETAAAQDEKDMENSEDAMKHASARMYLTAALKFCEQISAAIPVISQLMGSSTKTEVNESIRFMSRARSYGLPGACSRLRAGECPALSSL